MADAVRIEGLADLRRDMRALDPAIRKEMQQAFKAGAVLVAAAARPLTRSKTGATAAAWRAGTSGNSAFVRNRKPQAGWLEFGGTIRPRGVPITIRPTPAATRALALNEERIVDKLGDGIDAVAGRHGFR